MVSKNTLTGIVKGLNQGLGDLQRSGGFFDQLQKRQREKEAIEQEVLEQLQKEAHIEDLESSLKKKDPVEKLTDFGVEKLGDLLGVELEGYHQLKADKIKQDELVELFIKENHLPKNKETRKEVKNYLLSLSAPHDNRPFNEKHPNLSTLKEYIADPIVATGGALKDLLFQDYTDPQTYKNLGSTLLQTPYRLGGHLVGLAGNLDKKFHGEQATLAEHLEPAKRWLKDVEEGIPKGLGSDTDYKGKEGAEMLADMFSLPGARAAKGANALTRALKNTAVGLGEGGAYGALYGEGDPEAIKRGAVLGGALKGTLGTKKSKAQKLENEFAGIKERATFEDPDMIQRRAELMGKGATIPEVVGDETLINRLKTDTSRENISRMRKMESNLKSSAKDISKGLPKEEALDLYKNLENLQSEVLEGARGKYDTVKETGIGKQGLLDKGVITNWVRAIKNAEPNVKGLPKMKQNGGAWKDIEKLMQISPEHPTRYFGFSKDHLDILPTASDFLTFRSKIKTMLEKADSSQHEGLSVLLKDLDRIIEKVDPNSSLAKARKEWVTKVVPLKQKAVKEAITASKFDEAHKGKPSIKKVFGEQSIENSQLFEMLPTQDKKRVLGSFLQEVLSNEEKYPPRAIMETWKKVPDYIKKTADPEIRKILKQMETMAQTSKTLSSSQSATKEDIGSRLPTKDLSKAVRGGLYAGSLLSGNPSSTAIIFGSELAGRGMNRLQNKNFRKLMDQKNLKYYFDPQLLEELEKRRRIPYRAIANREENDELP